MWVQFPLGAIFSKLFLLNVVKALLAFFFDILLCLSFQPICILNCFDLQKFCSNLIRSPEHDQATPKTSRGVGRPKKLFEEKGPNAQYREASEILSTLDKYSFEAIIRALSLLARKEKKIHAAAIFHELEEDTDCRALRLRQAKKFFEEYPRKILPKIAHNGYHTNTHLFPVHL